MLGEDVSCVAERPGNRNGTGQTGNRPDWLFFHVI
jgi:hypothetical protein